MDRNPRQLPPEWTVAKLKAKHTSQAYNPDIANAFFRAGQIEAWGRGVERILEACRQMRGVRSWELEVRSDSCPTILCPPQGEIVLYQTEDGRSRVECRFANETLWLSQALIAELFQVSVPTVIYHLKTIYEEPRLDPESNYPKIPDSSPRGSPRGGPRDRALQPRCHSGGRVPGSLINLRRNT